MATSSESGSCRISDNSLLFYICGRLDAFEGFIETHISHGRRLVVDAYSNVRKEESGGIIRVSNTVVLRPSYTPCKGETLDKVELVVIPEKKGVGIDDFAAFLETEVQNDRIFQQGELANFRDASFNWREFLHRRASEKARMICSVIKKNANPGDVLDAIFGYMVRPCICYARHLGEYAAKQ